MLLVGRTERLESRFVEATEGSDCEDATDRMFVARLKYRRSHVVSAVIKLATAAVCLVLHAFEVSCV